VIRLPVNGTVLPQDDSLPVAQALAVKDGRIVEVGGTDAGVLLGEPASVVAAGTFLVRP
jgi:predicted amidohydrolase YtcJ